MENTFVLTYFIYGMSVTEDEKFQYNSQWTNKMIYFWVCHWLNSVATTNTSGSYIKPTCNYDLRKEVIKPDFDLKSITVQPDFHNFYTTENVANKTIPNLIRTTTKEPSAGFSLHSNDSLLAILIISAVYLLWFHLN